MKDSAQIRVAIVGSGMAGLATAYLLHNDRHSRYDVTVFEQGPGLSLDSASVSLADGDGRAERVDLPMRAFAGGYYRNLKAMYDHLGVQYEAKRFLFSFSFSDMRKRGLDAAGRTYFVHSSNNHRIPPIRPPGMGWVRHLIETAFLIVCYFWMTLCCLVSQPGPDETFGQWTERMWLPRRFATHYVLPLFCGVATCSHAQLLQFPASDLINYKRLTQSADHFVVTGGVQNAQKELGNGLNWKLNSEVVRVEPQDEQGMTKLLWKRTGSNSKETETVTFHHVILAVSPDLVGSIFPRIRKDMSKIPTTWVDNLVLQPQNGARRLRLVGNDINEGEGSRSRIPQHNVGCDVIDFRTSHGVSAGTEAWHTVNCGAIVRTTNTIAQDALEDPNVLHRWLFRRVLRTPESRKIVSRVLRLEQQPQQRSAWGVVGARFNLGPNPTAWGVLEAAIRFMLNIPAIPSHEKRTSKGPLSISPATRPGGQRTPDEWQDGDDGVFIVGGWAWDGMVLLEGCVTSAMRVARRFDVDIPWEASLTA